MRSEHGFPDIDDSEFAHMTYEPTILGSMHVARETSEQWGTGTWDTSPLLDGALNFTHRGYENIAEERGYENIAGESDSLADQETTLEKMWSWSADVCSQIWEKLEPVVLEHLPEDRNPFWVCGVFVLVVFLSIAGLRVGVRKQDGVVEVFKAEAVKVVDLSPINAPHIKLPDGRRVAYREQGVSQEFARYTILMVHGFPSSRLAGIPGIKTRLLEEFGVRLIAYDRPGFGESDAHSRGSLRASARDMAHIADALGVKDQFWVVGYSTGGIYAWAAMKYIPRRLAGVGFFAPGGNIYAPNMTKQESSEIWNLLTFHQKLLYRVGRWIPSVLPFFCKRAFLENVEKVHNDYLVTIGKDHVLMQQEMFLKALMRDVEESLRQSNAATIAQEFLVQVRPWEFHLSDFRVQKRVPNSGLLSRLRSIWKEEEGGWEGFSAPIHIWQGTDDRVVPLGVNNFAVRMVPQAILHRLEGEGHFSYFWFCDKCHRSIFLTLFKEPQGVRAPVTENFSSGGLESLYQTYEQTQKSS